MLPQNRLVLLTGANGYIAARLLPRLEAAGHRVRCLTRNAAALAPRLHPGAEVAHGDLLDPASLPAAMEGVDTAYYFSHPDNFAGSADDGDPRGAENLVNAARAAGVRRIVSLSPLRPAARRPVADPRSASQAGQTPRAGDVPVIEFRASFVLGEGSPSCELLSALVRRQPVLVCPRGSDALAQPIHIDDLLSYLVAGIDVPAGNGRVYEVGGPDRASLAGLLRAQAGLLGLRRIVLRVPGITPRLSRFWIGLVAPGTPGARARIDGLREPSVIEEPVALAQFPNIRPIGLTQALRRALGLSDEPPATEGGESTTDEACPPDRTRGGLRRAADEWARRARHQEHRALSAWSRWGRWRAWRPAVDCLETERHVLVSVEIPGVTPDQVELALEDDVLRLRGRREPAPARDSDVVLRCERAAGPFERAIPLTAPVDPADVSAVLENGIMRVRLTKRPECVTRKIPIKG